MLPSFAQNDEQRLRQKPDRQKTPAELQKKLPKKIMEKIMMEKKYCLAAAGYAKAHSLSTAKKMSMTRTVAKCLMEAKISSNGKHCMSLCGVVS